METEHAVRRPAVAGIFYSGTHAELQTEVEDLLRDAAAPAVAGTLIALIVPHAGYMYSGATAAKAYALIQGRTIDTCVLVGPSHQEYFQGISVYPGSAYETPLGQIDIDADLRADLLSRSTVVHASMQGHRGEHSLEVQLPFLQ